MSGVRKEEADAVLGAMLPIGQGTCPPQGQTMKVPVSSALNAMRKVAAFQL